MPVERRRVVVRRNQPHKHKLRRGELVWLLVEFAAALAIAFVLVVNSR